MEVNVISHSPTISVIAVSGEIDMYNADQLKSAISDLFQDGRTAVVLDLSELVYIDSSGIGVLIFAVSQARRAEIPLWLAGIHGTPRKIIKLTSLLEFFPVVDTVQDAIQRINQA